MIKIKNSRNVIQVFAWIALFLFFFNISYRIHPAKYALITSSYDTVMLFLMFRITVSFLFPRFYKKTHTYLLYSVIAIILFTTLYFLIDVYLISTFRHSVYHKPPLFFHFFRMLITTSFMFFVGTSIRLFEHTSQLREKEKLLVEEKLNTELKLLKAQINPHFIFNALNNIYSLTYTKANNAPESVLKLSEMLRYVLYDCSKDYVALNAEINYIENFITFQQMKSDYTQNITIHCDVEQDIEIAPMLFIPFIENAFKYSRIEELEDANVNISITGKKTEINFSIENSIPEENKSTRGSGTGIQNVQHRLNILYPDNHKLLIKEQNDRFFVNLILAV